MKIDEIEVSKISRYAQNNRLHSDEQIDSIARSISEFGFTQPLVIDECNVLLVGEGRWLASQKLNLQKVPVFKVVGLSDVQKKAYRILDNKIQNESTWNFEALQHEVAALEAAEFPLEEWGLDRFKTTFGDTVEEQSAEKEWSGMPEFDISDQSAHQSIKVHFARQEDVEAFAKLVDQSVTDKTRSLWYPKQEAKDLMQMKIVVDES